MRPHYGLMGRVAGPLGAASTFILPMRLRRSVNVPIHLGFPSTEQMMRWAVAGPSIAQVPSREDRLMAALIRVGGSQSSGWLLRPADSAASANAAKVAKVCFWLLARARKLVN